MGWDEIIQNLQERVEGTVYGYITPIDDVPFFTVCYPPEREREALREFRQLSERFKANDFQVEIISMKDIFKEALSQLGVDSDEDSLIKFESSKNSTELRNSLARYLPQEITKILYERLKDKDEKFIAILTRTGSLYPFARTSSIRSKLENKIKCVLVIAYPANNVGDMLGDPSFGVGGYYRGEIISWG